MLNLIHCFLLKKNRKWFLCRLGDTKGTSSFKNPTFTSEKVLQKLNPKEIKHIVNLAQRFAVENEGAAFVLRFVSTKKEEFNLLLEEINATTQNSSYNLLYFENERITLMNRQIVISVRM